jgi:hypothetical protein
MVTKLLMVNGSIPYLQIIIGIIIGAIGMFIYAKFYRPKILYDDDVFIEDVVVKKSDMRPSGTKKQQLQQQQQQQDNILDDDVNVTFTQQPPPTFIDLRGTIPMPMPNLSAMYQKQEYEEQSEDDDDDDEEEEDDEEPFVAQIVSKSSE